MLIMYKAWVGAAGSLTCFTWSFTYKIEMPIISLESKLLLPACSNATWQIANLSCQPKCAQFFTLQTNRSFELFQWNLHDIKKQMFCHQLLWVGPLAANTIWRHNKGFHLSISDSAQHVGMHRLLLQAQSSFLDGNHKKCEIICQLYIFFWSLPVVDQEKNLNILLYSDLNVPGELRWWLILYWPLVSDMLVVVS